MAPKRALPEGLPADNTGDLFGCFRTDMHSKKSAKTERRSRLSPWATSAVTAAANRMPLGQSQDIPQTNPLDTTIALQHLIFEGTLDRFPGLKVLAAHGG